MSDGRMETVAEAVERLTRAGFPDDFRAVAGGLRGSDGVIHSPERLIAEEVVRFEGQSDPGDEAIVFALRCTDTGTRGTYVVPFGPGAPALDAQMLQRLRAWIPDFDPALQRHES